MKNKLQELFEKLRTRLDGANKRLKDFDANVKRAGEKGTSDAKAMLAGLDAKAKEQQAQIASAQSKLKDWAQHTQQVTDEKIAEWKANREVSQLENRAQDADDYADSAILVASAAVDEAERAIAVAILAQVDLDAVKSPGMGARS